MNFSSSTPAISATRPGVDTLDSQSMTQKQAYWRPLPRPRNSLLFVISLYALLISATTAFFMADTSDYVNSVLARLQGRNYDFWDFGHLLWRPLGWSSVVTLRLFHPNFATTDARYTVTLLLIGINLIAGFAALYCLHRLVSNATEDFWLASLATIGFATAQAFLNFVHAGTAYIPGLGMLVIAVYALGVDEGGQKRTLWSILGGTALAFAVLLWFPYMLVIPAVILLPLIVRSSWRTTIVAAATLAVVGGVVYSTIAWNLGLHSISAILNWVRASNHGIDQIKGVSRVVFGFARSFINMDKDGILFKRYLLHDPYSPVSLFQLVRLSLGKLLLFYAWMAAIIAALIFTNQKRALLLLGVALLPVLAFAVNWQGGDMERYLAAYPFLFLAFAIALKNRPPRFLKYVIIGFVPLMMLVNISALLRSKVGRHETEVAQRLQDIRFDELGNGRLFVVQNQDDVFNFVRSFPSAPINRNRTFQLSAILELGRVDTPLWRATFSRLATQIWDRGDSVWVSERVFSPVPKPEWNWVEGQDRRVSWKDLKPFFSALQFDKCVGGDDGFCLLAASPANRQFLTSVRSTK